MQLIMLRSQKAQALTTYKFSKISLSGFATVKCFLTEKSFNDDIIKLHLSAAEHFFLLFYTFENFLQPIKFGK